MTKIEIKNAVKDLAEKYKTYDNQPLEGCETFSHTFNGRSIQLTLEKDQQIQDFIVNNFGVIQKDTVYKFKFCNAPQKTYTYAKISFTPTSNEDMISGTELRIFLKAVFKNHIIAQISTENVNFGKFVLMDHSYAKNARCSSSSFSEQFWNLNLVDSTIQVKQLHAPISFIDVKEILRGFSREDLSKTYNLISDSRKQQKIAEYNNRIENRKTATLAGKILSQLDSSRVRRQEKINVF